METALSRLSISIRTKICSVRHRLEWEWSVRAAYPDALDQIVCWSGTPVGRVLVNAAPDGNRLVDIALLAEFRNRCIGTQIIQEAIAVCERNGCVLRLQVLRGNPALRLYLRIGFRETSSDAMYIQMERTP